MKCPYCKATIDDDSRFCDQCGQTLKFCPECRQPKRGTECAACGADLVDADRFFACQNLDQPQGTDQPENTQLPTVLEGEGFRLTLKEGVFGRTMGIYPELGTVIYVSGCHGELRCLNGQWQIRDLGSRNGTFLNGRKLVPNAWADLALGDQLKIATILFTVK